MTPQDIIALCNAELKRPSPDLSYVRGVIAGAFHAGAFRLKEWAMLNDQVNNTRELKYLSQNELQPK